jgi:hypothetical protein
MHGVACVTCHLAGGQIVTWQKDRACTRCHQFSFPDGSARVRPEWMQTTVDEHRASELRDKDCVDCHMPLQDGHRSHRFAGGHDADLLRRSIKVRASRQGPGEVLLTLMPLHVGHAFPTGDLFRRIEVRLSALLPEGKTVLASRYLMRHLAMETQVPGTFTQVVRSDDRLFGETTLHFSLPEAAGNKVEWTLTYQRVVLPGARPSARSLDGSVILASGTL